MPADTAGLRVNDRVISLDGNLLPPGIDLPSRIVELLKKDETVTLSIERGAGDDLLQMPIQIEPKPNGKDGDRKIGAAFGNIPGYETFTFERCQGVVGCGNEIDGSSLTAVRLKLCSDSVLALNSVFETSRGNHEGNIHVVHTDGVILAFNDLHRKNDYGGFLSDSRANIVCDNQIRGGDVGIRLQGSENILRGNLIAGTGAGILLSAGNMSIIEKNIFERNKSPLQGEKTYWSSAIVKTNLMDTQIDSNSLGNTRLVRS